MMILHPDKVNFFRHTDQQLREFTCEDTTLTSPVPVQDQYISITVEQSQPTVLYVASSKAISVYQLKGKDKNECTLEGKVLISDLTSAGRQIQQIAATNSLLFAYMSDGSFEVFKLSDKGINFIQQVESQPFESRAVYSPASL